MLSDAAFRSLVQRSLWINPLSVWIDWRRVCKLVILQLRPLLA